MKKKTDVSVRAQNDVAERPAMPTAIELDGALPRPPWLVFPEIEWGSIHWRMGEGEEYLWAFVQCYSQMDPSSRAEYRGKFPQPADWTDFYERFERNILAGRHDKPSSG